MGGNLIERSVDLDGAGAGTPVVTKHAYDENGNAWADLTAGGSLTTRRLYADAVDALMARIGSSNDEDWYLTDLLGSVRDIADSTGAGINHLDYNTFGGVATETSPTDGDRYAWTGRERDVETGLQYNRARWYDPATKRWLSQDPMGFDAGDSNLYRYATNSAASSTDPSGLDEIPSNMRASKAQLGGDCRMANGGNISKSPFDLSALAQSGKKAKVYPNQIIWTGDYDNLLAAQKSQQASPPLYRDLVPNDMQAKATPAFIAHQRFIGVQSRFMTESASLVPIPGVQQGIMYFNQFMDQVDPYSVSQIPRMIADTRSFNKQVANSLTNATAKKQSGIYRITTRNSSDVIDSITTQEIGRRIANDPVAYRAYRQIQETGREVILDFGTPPIPGAAGSASNGLNVTLYMRNIDSIQEAVSTIVHESNHAIRLHQGSAFRFRWNQMEEYRAFRREFLFQERRRPTLLERRAILRNVANDDYYGQLPTGNVPPSLR